jgi:hypothetical protein
MLDCVALVIQNAGENVRDGVIVSYEEQPRPCRRILLLVRCGRAVG